MGARFAGGGGGSGEEEEEGEGMMSVVCCRWGVTVAGAG